MSIMDIDFYPDADLFGIFVHEKPMGTLWINQQTIYFITVSDFHILCKHKFQTWTEILTIETNIILLAHRCSELFTNMETVDFFVEAVGIPTGDTNINLSIHDDYYGLFVMGNNFPTQFTPHKQALWYKYNMFSWVYFQTDNQVVKDINYQLVDIFNNL